MADQKTAIEWVKDNARRFGGDPNSITLLGHSSGAESIVAQVCASVALIGASQAISSMTFLSHYKVIRLEHLGRETFSH